MIAMSTDCMFWLGMSSFLSLLTGLGLGIAAVTFFGKDPG